MPRSRITSSSIKRLRSEPRSISLAGSPNGKTPLKDSDTVREEEVEEKVAWIPRVVNSVQMRPEINQGIPSSLHTSVEKVPEAGAAEWIKPPRRSRRQKSSLDMNSIVVDRTLDLDPIRKIDRAELSYLGKKLRATGLEVNPGQTVILNVLYHTESDPNPIISGSQAVRLSTLNEAGILIGDLELPPAALPYEVQLPTEASRLCITGLGGEPEIVNEIKPGPGSISTRCSTDNTAAIGFHPFSRLVNTLSSSALFRGGVVMTGREDKFAWSTSSGVLESSKMITMQMTSSIDVFVVVHSSATEVDVNFVGAEQIGSNQVDIGSFKASIYSLTRAEGILQIRIASEKGSPIHSAFGVLGNAKDWIRTLKSNEISTIVEEGAISQTGVTLVSFDAQFTLPSTKAARQKVTPEPRKPKASVSEYDLGQLIAGQAFKRNIAELAIDDDEGDILVFRKAGGPSFIDVTPVGSITAIPTPDNIGKFVIEIEVKDLDGEIAVASFYGEVVKSRNTAPRWKGGEK
jgi:hypothetical protein